MRWITQWWWWWWGWALYTARHGAKRRRGICEEYGLEWARWYYYHHTKIVTRSLRVPSPSLEHQQQHQMQRQQWKKQSESMALLTVERMDCDEMGAHNWISTARDVVVVDKDFLPLFYLSPCLSSLSPPWPTNKYMYIKWQWKQMMGMKWNEQINWS